MGLIDVVRSREVKSSQQNTARPGKGTVVRRARDRHEVKL